MRYILLIPNLRSLIICKYFVNTSVYVIKITLKGQSLEKGYFGLDRTSICNVTHIFIHFHKFISGPNLTQITLIDSLARLFL